MEFEQYLKQELAPSTAKRYQREIDLFFLSIENPITADYNQILDYIEVLRTKTKNIACSLSAIKRYYTYLNHTKQRKYNPAKSIKLRDKISRDIQLQDLFTTKELSQLLERKERYVILKNRNKITTSLLIYQGLKSGEIANLELKDIDLEKGTIYIKAGNKSNSRTLKLQSKQVFWIMKYLQEDRPILLKSESNKLLIGNSGIPLQIESISYLIEVKKPLFPTRNLNPKTIRQSVISNLLKDKKDLRLVQVFAGHKTPSTTEKYKQTEVEELKNQILKYHPLQ